MMKKIIILIFIFVIFFAACKQTEDKSNIVIASVGNKKLYINDIKQNIPNNMTSEDSTFFVNEYIYKWKLDNLLYAKALKNIDDTIEIVKEINNYRKQLYIHNYLEDIYEKEVNFTVTFEEIENYYKNHIDNYILTATFIKAHYFRMSSKIATYYNVIDKLKATALDNTEDLENFCIGTNRNIYFIREWQNFDDFLLSLKCKHKISDEELQNNNILDLVVGDYRYIIKIDDFKLKKDLAPLDMFEDDIAKIIINNRKNDKYIEIKNKLMENNVK